MTQLTLPLQFPTNYSEEDFLIADCNRAAWMAVRSWTAEPAGSWLLRGPKASGKTHLACIWAQHCDARIIEGHNITANTPPADLFEGHHSTVILNADTANETSLFHLLNHIKEQKSLRLLLTLSSEVSWDDIALPDLRSRLKALPQAEISPPDDALLGALLLKHSHERQLRITQHALEYLLPRIERSFKGALHIIEKIDAYAASHKREVTRDLVRDWFQQI